MYKTHKTERENNPLESDHNPSSKVENTEKIRKSANNYDD
jgi:hypothetical protein